MFSETDLHVSHSYKFGQDNRFTLQGFVDVLNLFDQKNELTRQTVISPDVIYCNNASNWRLSDAAVCANEVAAIQQIFNGGTQAYIENYLAGGGVAATIAARKFNTYNLTNGFQIPRSVRFGFRMFF